MLGRLIAPIAVAAALVAPAALASHIPGSPCNDCVSHAHWPSIDGKLKKAVGRAVTFLGTDRSDELLGHHWSDTLIGKQQSDVLWGDWKGGADQPTNQRDEIHGGDGTDFIYGSHGRNVIRGGAGNDAISVHYGRGRVDCGPGRDIYHVARSRKRRYKFRNCEKVDYRTESQRGGGLKPLA